MTTIELQCKNAQDASRELISVSNAQKTTALIAMSEALAKNWESILKENEKDLNAGKENGLSKALIDRLQLTKDRILDMAESIRTIAVFKDPIGETLTGWVLPNGVNVSKVRVPLGVIGIIYEARPNVTSDAIALAIKTGNAIVLRGSSSAVNSNQAIASVLKEAAQKAGIEQDCIQLLNDTSREGVRVFLKMNAYLSVIIPRGSGNLIREVIEHATVPTIETGEGNCHLYVDAAADLQKAEAILINAKTQRPSVCNACETLIIHQSVAEAFAPSVLKKLQDMGVEIRGCAKTKALFASTIVIDENEWHKEYLDMILAVKIVTDIDEAIDHINRYGTRHTETIVTNDIQSSSKFSKRVDAAAIAINASSRFTDGGVFGFGAEMGISTQKLHARGPLGLTELTTYKYLIEGDGQVRT
jgi:glutamate-5-semialdehyde dehydrogenase